MSTSNYLYQVFRGNTIFCVVEYLFGVPQQNSTYPLDEYPFIIRKIPTHARALLPVNCSDSLVKSVSKNTQVAYQNINLNV